MKAAYRLLLTLLATRGRIVAGAGAGAVIVALAAVGVATGQGRGFTIELLTGGGLALLVPVTALLFATAVLGDLAEDRTLAYLWLLPLPRWQLGAAATAAVWTVALPVAAIPLLIAAAVAGSARLAVAALAASCFAVLAYSPLFVALGLRSRRAILYGLLYVILWENVASRLSSGLARSTVRVHAETLFAAWSEARLPRFAPAPSVSVVVLLLVAAVGGAVTIRLLETVEPE